MLSGSFMTPDRVCDELRHQACYSSSQLASCGYTSFESAEKTYQNPYFIVSVTRCSSCKRLKTRHENFSFGAKTCDSCCLKKRYRRREMRSFVEELRRARIRHLPSQERTCSTCKCRRAGHDFDDVLKKTCKFCLQLRQLKRKFIISARTR